MISDSVEFYSVNSVGNRHIYRRCRQPCAKYRHGLFTNFGTLSDPRDTIGPSRMQSSSTDCTVKLFVKTRLTSTSHRCEFEHIPNLCHGRHHKVNKKSSHPPQSRHSIAPRLLPANSTTEVPLNCKPLIGFHLRYRSLDITE